MNSEPIIRVQNLVVAYGERTVLNDISFTVTPGEIFMVIGGSGCGKTTLLNSMIGLLATKAGAIFIENDDITKATELSRIPILRKIGVMYQNGALFGSMSLLDNVKLPLEELTNLPREAIHEIALNKLKTVGLGEFSNYFPAEISGGMQKRAAIARAMALDPKILFLDEPTSGLDPVISNELDQVILNLSKTLGITFIIVTHDLASIFNIGQRVILLHQGAIVAAGKPQDLRTHGDPIVKKFFLRNFGIDNVKS